MPKVLFVEDNHIYRKTFREEFSRQFPTLIIEEAADAEEAFEKVTSNPPDYIITDLRLPGMNGLQLTKKVKEKFPHIQIAILTGYDVAEYRLAAPQYGAEHFFTKAFLNWEEVREFLTQPPK